MIDWPNLLIGTVLAAVFYWIGKRDGDRNHKQLVALLEKREREPGDIKLEKDTRGNIVGVASMHLKVEAAQLTAKGGEPTLRIDTPRDSETGP